MHIICIYIYTIHRYRYICVYVYIYIYIYGNDSYRYLHGENLEEREVGPFSFPNSAHLPAMSCSLPGKDSLSLDSRLQAADLWLYVVPLLTSSSLWKE